MIKRCGNFIKHIGWSGAIREYSPALFFVDFYVQNQDFLIVLIPLLVPQRGLEMKQLPDLQRVACVGADRDRTDYLLNAIQSL